MLDSLNDTRDPNPRVLPTMKRPTLAFAVGAFLALCSTSGIAAVPVVVSTVEDWNGLVNPHEADGVTLTGTGAPGDPAVYTIPSGLTITAGGGIRLTSNLDDAGDSANITFVLEKGDLQIEEGGFLETCLGNRGDNREFVLDLGGGSVKGAGRIVGLRAEGPRNRKPRGVTIQNVVNVSLKEIDLHVEDISSEVPGALKIVATGRVHIPGKVDISDIDTGGNPVNDIRIDAESIEIGSLDTRSLRPAGRRSGSIFLRALSAEGGFDPAAGGNTISNRVTLNGPIRTDGLGDGGNVTVQGVVLQVGGNFGLATARGSAVTLNAGVDTLGTPKNDLFIDSAGANIAPLVKYAVQWNGIAAAGSAPAFSTDPMTRAKAVPDAPYTATLAGSATDPDNNTLTFARGMGPAWLSVAPDGSLSGTPTAGDAGMNSWTISVSDGTRVDIAQLRIGVSGRPTFLTHPVLKPNGAQNQPYADTLADTAADPDGDPVTFAKLDGPAWLSVAANGALSGTPPSTATSTNQWTVTVSDATGSDSAQLVIVVGGVPRWLSDPVIKPVARSGLAYAGSGQTLALDAIDPDGGPVQFEKVSGPSWLQVASGGALSGTPSDADVGVQSWTVRASDGTGDSVATLKIEVFAKNATIEISRTEVWDGVQNPHAAEGVALTGTGTAEDPAVYTIPNGLRFTPSGAIQMTSQGGPDNHIKFVVSGGNIEMASGSVINLGRLKREDLSTCLLDLGGGSILGSGQILGLLLSDDSPRQLTIENAKDISLSSIDLHVVNANNGNRNLTITASGVVTIPAIDIGDRDSGGNQVGSVIVKADSIMVGSIDVRSMRTGSYRGNGNIELTALGAPAYDPAAAAGNDFANQIVVTGRLRSRGPEVPPSPGTDGNITLQGVAVHLDSSVGPEVPEGSTVTVSAGVIRSGTVAGDLFSDLSGTVTAQHTVEWSGGVSVPSAPTLLGVESFAATALRITWSTADLLATEFLVEQSTDGAVFTQAAALPGGVRRCEIGGLAANQTYYFRLRSSNSAGTSAWSGVGSATTPDWGINVNFASSEFKTGEPGYPIPGYRDDYGDVFGDRGNGQSYGWLEDNTATTRVRRASNSPDPRYDTLIHLQRNGDFVWEMALPNGSYQVRVVAGDPGATDSMFQFDLEGQITDALKPSAVGNAYWVEFKKSCTVSDGRLTVRSGSQATNNKICFIDILRAFAEPPAIKSVSLSGGNVSIQWTGGGTLQAAPSIESVAWVDVATGGTWTEPATGGARFYRVRR